MIKAGILGGGQLGRMLLQAAANYTVETRVMENDPECPAAHLCHHFVQGDIRDFEDVYQFGKGLDVLTIEIESVNVEALEKLEQEGVKIYPKPAALRTIKNKILQKTFYQQHSIPTAPFIITQNRADLEAQRDFLPAVHKLGEGGYDGRGVQVLQEASQIAMGFDAPSVLEKKISIHQEIALIIAVSNTGELAVFPPVDMVFDPALNQLDYQISPANVPQEVLWKLEAISIAVVKGLNSPGIFAVELFVDPQGEVLVNETAPRVHNSGHHTIEGNFCSQFDMLWRIMLDLPPGNTRAILPSALVNLVGADNHSGTAYYEGLKETMEMDNLFVHLYGKAQTRPGRKMGHVTILGGDKETLVYRAHKVKQTLSVISAETLKDSNGSAEATQLNV